MFVVFVCIVFEGLVVWIKGEVECSVYYWLEVFYFDMKMVLVVVDKFVFYGIDYILVICVWWFVFDYFYVK